MFIARQRRGLTPTIKRELRRRSAIEPMIGHMKQDGRLGRNHLLGAAGDAINALLVAAGHNLRLILNWLRLFVAWLLAALMGSSCNRIRRRLPEIQHQPRAAALFRADQVPWR
ncbi:hypothetical protein GR304_22145 [Microvirga sp. SYSU G3D207]|uniref:Transposase DDE domain-containing protein n=1 Tax=Microvirga arsenatis TaxID=2692265 RepID=A0ABW9Z3E4_9HYPH|nr:hypothetical protein [Microvirga arsenatis]NBJ27052.1 hypothetical protein [Microvirga arsenatis]